MTEPVCDIAVVIPVYNVTAFLTEAIASVASQDIQASEIIVVDDGSRDEHAQVIRDICAGFPQIIHTQIPHAGTAAARDAGVARSRASSVLFLDGDDILQPGALRFFADAMESHPQAIAVYGRYRRMDATGNAVGNAKPGESRQVSGRALLHKLLELKSPFMVGSVCIRRHALEQVTAQNHALIYGEDWVLWCHLALMGEIVYAGDQVLMHYRKHDENVTRNYIRNPERVLETYDTIFRNPLFIKEIGEEPLRAYEAYCLQLTHMRLAAYYARNAQPEKARHHMQQMTVELTPFVRQLKD